MLNVRDSPGAAAQYEALPDVAADRIDRAVRVIQSLPHAGKRLRDDRELFELVVRVRRGSSSRVIDEVVGPYLDPSWLERDLIP